MRPKIYITIALLSAILNFSCQTNQVEKRDKNKTETSSNIDFTNQTTTKLIPLIDLKDGINYKGENGGLYGDGNNEIPAAHLLILKTKIAEIKPVNGKIGFISIGMSNTSYEFKYFMRLVENDKNKSNYLSLCNGAQGGVTADEWADASSKAWNVLDQRIIESALTSEQVQIIWLKTAHKQPTISMPNENSDAVQLEKDMISIVNILKDKFVNLKVIYFSSRIYAGYATSELNPEPFAYESGFAVRNVILQQINGNQTFEIKTTPALVWGPYLWADGENKNSAGLTWSKSDYDPKDFTHPGRGSGIEKVGNILYDFFTTHELTKQWYYYH